ncbi:MAG: VWA domain-containing protein [Planctomycetaceae bacterium]
MLRRKFVVVALGCLTLLLPSVGLAVQSGTASAEVTVVRDATAIAEKSVRQPKIQMAILLDTSGSMSGLIDQARTQLWNIVNEFATTKQDGKRPVFELSIYEYGKSSVSAEDGYIRLVLPFSDNLDKASEELFKLTTAGGSEHCGQGIDRAAQQVEWSDSSKDLKCIFIAGNEPFTQGPIDYREACKTAITRGITVNTIHCGSRTDGINGRWGDGALLADGAFTSIDHNARIAIEAPQDKELIRLSAEVNKTYIAYGTKSWRETNTIRQSVQDGNAVNSNQAAAATRALAKCSVLYCNDSWDLVDALKNKKIKLEDIKTEQLPKNMQSMSLEERRDHIATLEKQRSKLQEKVKALGKEREKFVAAEMKKLAAEGKNVLQQAVIEAARLQYQKKGFKRAGADVASSK